MEDNENIDLLKGILLERSENQEMFNLVELMPRCYNNENWQMDRALVRWKLAAPVRDTFPAQRIFANSIGHLNYESFWDYYRASGLFIRSGNEDMYSYYREYMSEKIDTFYAHKPLFASSINCFLGAAFHRNSYALNLLIAFLKRDRKEEYELVKDLSTVDFRTLFTLAVEKHDRELEKEGISIVYEEEIDPFVVTLSVLLCLCELLDIKMDEDVTILYMFVQFVLEEFESKEKIRLERALKEDYYNEELFEQANYIYDQLIKDEQEYRLSSKDEFRGTERFLAEIYEGCGIPKFLFLQIAREKNTTRKAGIKTICAMLNAGIRNYSLKDVLEKMVIFMNIECHCNNYKASIYSNHVLLGIDDKIPEYLLEIDPGKKEIIEFEEKAQKSIDDRITILRTKNEILLSENSELKEKLREKEQRVKNNHLLYEEEKKKVESLLREKENWEKEHLERASLQDYVYKMDSDFIEDANISNEEMLEVLKEKRIAIVGGHETWINKLKNVFPDWIYIPATDSHTLNERVIQNVDYLFFYNKYLSHSSYYKYRDAAFRYDIPFGYIHKMNVDEVIKYVYEVTVE